MESTFRYPDLVTNFDFRKTFWGMSRSDVKISEGSYPLSENETHITYDDIYMEMQATIGFHFIDDSLIEAGYAFREFYPDIKLYIAQYERVKTTLTNLYGNPVIQSDNCLYNKEKSNYETVEEECTNLIFLDQWQTTRSNIRLLFYSDYRSSEFGILYLSRHEETDIGD